MANPTYPRVYGIAHCYKPSTEKTWFHITCNGEFWNLRTDSPDNPPTYRTRADALADLDNFVPLTSKD